MICGPRKSDEAANGSGLADGNGPAPTLNPELIWRPQLLLGLYGLAVDKVGKEAEDRIASLNRARRAAGGGNAAITQRFPDG